jgi:hypothetical protein
LIKKIITTLNEIREQVYHMEFDNVIKHLSLSGYSVGLGGCKAHKTTLSCCEYNLTVFDDKKEKDAVHAIDDITIKLHHGTLGETNIDVLQKYDSMVILSDPNWSLRMFLSNLKEKQQKIRRSCMKGCLVTAASLAAKALQDLSVGEFAPVWLKCAAFFICDALVLLNSKSRSPTHILEFLRNLEPNKTNESFSTLADAIGLERATPSLLERMVKSTIGFSDMAENNNHSKIIAQKYRYLVDNSLLSDCYFYLGYINKNIVSVHTPRPDMIHLLKVALDLEHDRTKLERQAKSLHRLANELVHSQSGLAKL